MTSRWNPVTACWAAVLLMTLTSLLRAQAPAGSAQAPSVATPAVDSGGAIRVGPKQFHEFEAAVQAYARLNPLARMNSGDTRRTPTEQFLDGDLDVLFSISRFSYPNNVLPEEYQKAHGGEPEERVVAYRPLAVAVHPKNPMKSITIAQLRQLLFNPQARWSDLGRPTDGRIRMYSHPWRVAEAVAACDDQGTPPGPLARISHEEELVYNRAADAHRARIPMTDIKKVLAAMAEDEDGIVIPLHSKQLAASGLKILPVVYGNATEGLLPTDVAAVASGRYPLREELRVTVHHSAPGHVRALVAWLLTPEAGQAMAAVIPADNEPSPFVHVSMAGAGGAATPAKLPAAGQQAPAATFQGPIAGAVAVLPIESLSLYFLMGTAAQHAAYEQAITEALLADERLTVVDRVQLSRILGERCLQILGDADAPGKAIVSADVLVISHVVTEDVKTFLRIRAIHGPTGGLLSELKLPIDPAQPTGFATPLDQTVGRWWPAVLARLRDSREKPSMALVDVYPAALDLAKPAEAAREALQAALAADDGVFAPGNLLADEAQQEMLISILGLAAPSGGPFTPITDYLVDARLLDGVRLAVRLRTGGLETLAEETLTAADAKSLQKDAVQWLNRQIAAHRTRPAARPAAAPGIDEWARLQSRLELQMADELMKGHKARFQSAGRNGLPAITNDDLRELNLVAADARRHARRAAQLDPSSEQAVYAGLSGLNALWADVTTREANRQPLATSLAPLERFLSAFPKSKHGREVLSWHAYMCLTYAGSNKLAPVGDVSALRRALYRKGLESYERYLTRYCGNNKKADVEANNMTWGGYLFWTQRYLDYAEPAEREIEDLVSRWSERFDARPDEAVHSDFIRLMVMARQKDRAGFLDLLTRMQQRWPDPQSPAWSPGANYAQSMISRLFSIGSDNDTNTFRTWRQGKRGIGDLPKVGYKPEEYEPHYGGRLLFALPDGPIEVLNAIRAAGKAYKELQPGADINFVAPIPRRSNLKAVEDGLLLIVVGQLPAEDRQAIVEFLRGEPLMHRIGWLQGNDGTPAREVSVLLRPGAAKSEFLADVLRFLRTPKAAEAMAAHGLTLEAKGEQPNQRPPGPKKDAPPAPR